MPRVACRSGDRASWCSCRASASRQDGATSGTAAEPDDSRAAIASAAREAEAERSMVTAIRARRDPVDRRTTTRVHRRPLRGRKLRSRVAGLGQMPQARNVSPRENRKIDELPR